MFLAVPAVTAGTLVWAIAPPQEASADSDAHREASPANHRMMSDRWLPSIWTLVVGGATLVGFLFAESRDLIRSAAVQPMSQGNVTTQLVDAFSRMLWPSEARQWIGWFVVAQISIGVLLGFRSGRADGQDANAANFSPQVLTASATNRWAWSATGIAAVFAAMCLLSLRGSVYLYIPSLAELDWGFVRSVGWLFAILFAVAWLPSLLVAKNHERSGRPLMIASVVTAILVGESVVLACSGSLRLGMMTVSVGAAVAGGVLAAGWMGRNISATGLLLSLLFLGGLLLLVGVLFSQVKSLQAAGLVVASVVACGGGSRVAGAWTRGNPIAIASGLLLVAVIVVYSSYLFWVESVGPYRAY